MKTKICSIIILIFFFQNLFSQNKNETKVNTNPVKSFAQKLPNDKLANWLLINSDIIYEHNIDTEKRIRDIDPVALRAIGPPPQTALTVFKGKNFIANNCTSVPPDNFKAISNSGKIVAVDNNSIMEFDVNGQIIANTPWVDFFPDASLVYNIYFDPKVIYDKYSDRFILIVLYHASDYSDSRILMCFSNNISTGQVAWNYNFFNIKIENYYTNTSTTKYWFDYPNIAINKDELFITSNVVKRVNGVNQTQTASIFQCNKDSGYINIDAMPVIAFNEVNDATGNSAISIYPFSDGLQDVIYDDVMYFVDHDFPLTTNKIFWHKLVVNLSNSTLSTYSLTSTLSCISANYASQNGGFAEDRIRVSDQRIRGGFHKNGKLHFVLERSDSGWVEIAYFKINTNVTSSTITPITFGGLEKQRNFMYPSIACMSVDGDKSILTYASTGSTIFNQIWAVDNQNNNWGSPILIKNGLGLLNRTVYNNNASNYERIGDYTSIQRKYNSENAWLIGSYPFGSTQNNYGVINGLNGWISEVSLQPITSGNRLANQKYSIYPNPNINKTVNIVFTPNSGDLDNLFEIKDFTGKSVFQTRLLQSENLNIKIPELKKGIYFIFINSNIINYETQKLIID